MASQGFGGFGKESGPSLPFKSQIPIGNFPRPPSPLPPSPSPSPPPPPLPPPSFSDAAAPRSHRVPEAPERMRSPPLASENTRPASPSYPSARLRGLIESPPTLGARQKSFLKDYDAQTNQRPSILTSFVASRNSGTSVTAKIARFQDLKRNNSPPFLSTEENILRNSNQNIIRSSDLLVNTRSHLVPQRTQSPPLDFEHNRSIEDYRPPFGGGQRPAMASSAWVNHPMLPGNYANSPAHQNLSSVTPYVGSYYSKSFPTELADVLAPKRTRSPPLPSANEVSLENTHFARNDSKRPSISPPRLSTRSNILSNTPDSQTQQRSLPSTQNIDAEAASTKSTSSPVPKRTRSPPLTYDDEILQGNSYSSQDGTEREMQAKAKRLARFRVELSENVQSSSDITNQKISANRHDRSMVERGKFISEHSMEAAGDFPNGNVSTDYESLESSSIIIGLCPDMCPESERGERERKGDLDQYERLDGDRNQTTKSLAIKKYNRTAEREANLIRPMPVLQKTIDYLLNLLDQQYGDRFLGMYNFLWDRMRAIRMDLRMQHIFTLGAITMLEQMIRLHIIAMHELCEYTKGEGFSVGFDAHLNIEQMNKTSVELFQMYDDHRKKGINVPTEREFRGYYALLKLDKHPGYKVEPAELSLDLAKMTPEIRQTPEVLFARNVARACRTGNFVAFFRLARNASYLQACLMHAHFAKLRTQALASLHCGLQNNQGLPVAHAAKWLGMEEEDIESLLEYHGFSIKEFKEPYMVKEGPFLNGDKDYSTKCSKFVHLKKSKRIVEDVLSSFQAVSLPAEEAKEVQLGEISKHDPKIVQSAERESSIHAIDEEMSDFNAASSPKDVNQMQPMFQTSTVDQHSEEEHQVVGVNISPWNFPLAQSSPESWPAKIKALGKPSYDVPFGNSPERNLHSGIEGMPLQIAPGTAQQGRSSGSQVNYAVEDSVPSSAVLSNLEDEEPWDNHQEDKVDEVMANDQAEEAAEAKLKLILRLWKRRASKQRELREQRHLAANAALNLLSLGPPIRQNKHQLSTFGEFDIDQVMRERHEKHKKSWSRLNVSDVVANVLSQRNPNAKCLCWKIIVCSPVNNLKGDELGQSHQVAHLAAGPWLFSKLMPTRKDDDDTDNDDLVILPGLSIWKKWIPTESGTDLTCCLSVIKDTEFDDLNDTVCGASAVVFLVCESIPWELQKILLHNLLMSLPSGSCLPLLVLSDSYNEADSDPSSTIVNKLGLCNIDRSRISSFLVIFLVENQQLEHSDGFFSDERLREGLQWLASETPLQPVLHCVKTRELVVSHLNSSLEVLDKMSDYQVGPGHCISAFNETLDQSVGKIAAAANANPASWPCPEIALLEEFSNEQSVLNWCLPSIGWSSTAKIEPVMCALSDCKLPPFPDDISWLNRGSGEAEEIENQKLKLESCLIRYLNQSSNMMGYALATKEACIMLQKSARLELHNLSYYIVPKWVMIFRRIFNWRLMTLSSGAFSAAYVLEQHDVAPSTAGLDRLGLEGSVFLPCYLNYPSLDEMVEVGCNPLLSERVQSQAEGFQPLPGMVPNGDVQEATNTSNLMVDKMDFVHDGELAATDSAVYLSSGPNNGSSELVVATRATEGADRLSKLLQQCNIAQNMIGEKLSIYF